jgi:hypothetical protein
MNEQVKVFTFVSGHGTTLIDPPIEDHINQWLSATPGRIQRTTQSESERTGVGHHVTVIIWYVPERAAGRGAIEAT